MDLAQAIPKGSRNHFRQSLHIWIALGPVYFRARASPINRRLDVFPIAVFGGWILVQNDPKRASGRGLQGPPGVDLAQAIPKGNRNHFRQLRHIWLALGPVYLRARASPINRRLDMFPIAFFGGGLWSKMTPK